MTRPLNLIHHGSSKRCARGRPCRFGETPRAATPWPDADSTDPLGHGHRTGPAARLVPPLRRPANLPRPRL